MIVHQARLKDGTRRITHVTEVVGMEGDIITLQDIFKYDYTRSELVSTGIRPGFADKLADRGVFIPTGLFTGTERWAQ